MDEYAKHADCGNRSVGTLVFCVILYLFRNELKQKRVTKILILVCITRLVSDAIAWGFDGQPGLFWGTITRASNYLTFVSNDLVSLVFSVFLWQLVKRGAEKPPGAAGEQIEDGVPEQHVARHPHAHERHHRLHFAGRIAR